MNRNMSIALLLAASITVPVGAQAIPEQRSSSAPVVVKTPARSDAPPVVSNAPQDARQDGRKAAPQDAPTIAQGAAAGRAPERAAEPVDFHSAARAGEVALQSGDFAGAAAAYEAALAARPDAADAAYNLGVSLYKAGKYQDAAKAFARASTSASNGEHTDAALSASSLYNRAASFYSATRTQAEAAQRMLETQREATGTEPKEGQEAAIDPEALKQAIADANKSLGGFKDAAYADPNDQESRANAEQSLRLVRALEELKKQQDEQKKDDKENKDDQQDQSRFALATC
jgi:tetratricopeptide (TPR) repeat protein